MSAKPTIVLGLRNPSESDRYGLKLALWAQVCGEATQAKSLLSMLGEQQPDLCLCDYVFSDGTGGELLRILRANGIKTRLVFLSAVYPRKDLFHSPQAGFYDYLIKPVREEKVLQVLRRAMSV